MFLPTTREELNALGWPVLDVILVTGDAYIDSPYIGIAIIGKVLLNAGLRVGIIAQPDIHSGRDICRLGAPRLFWGVSGGCVDSLVANYTALKKIRNQDDYTPGGLNGKRPDRAVISYTNLIRRFYKKTKPIVLGGMEASLRRVAHYDFWSNSIRRSILCDAKADYLVYGMGEKTILALATALQAGKAVHELPGICYLSNAARTDYLQLPAYEQICQAKTAFIEMFKTFYTNNDPITAKGLCQQQNPRYLIQNPPCAYSSQLELDAIHGLDFERDLHPFYRRMGPVRAVETLRFSIPTHHGCYGECNFCAISVHQGRTVRWRSRESIVAEARLLAAYPDFKGQILDLGGPTANMYGFECTKKLRQGSCRKKRCLFPNICPDLAIDHGPQIQLLRELRKIKNLKHVFIASGLRYDLIISDKIHGMEYLREIIRHHISGQLKVAPEHSADHILRLMGKPEIQQLLHFKDEFYRLTNSIGKKQFLTYYMIAAHPGCHQSDMQRLKQFSSHHLKTCPEQVQIFTPTPSTFSSLMYYTESNPFNGRSIFVEKNKAQKQHQKNCLFLIPPHF